MTEKENALRIIRFDRPERVVSGLPTFDLWYLGCNHEGYAGGGHHLPVGSKWTDIWGTEWHREHPGVMGFPRGHPLADLPRALAHYTWPDPDDERIIGPVYRTAAKRQGTDSFVTGSHRDTLWEKSYMLVGMENLMCWFHEEPGAVRELLHRVMDFQLGLARHYVELGVELVSLTDDLGAQERLLLSPALIGEFLLPEYRRLFAFYKSRGIMVGFHSCGHVEPLIGTFMDLGVDILNPLQASANDLEAIRRSSRGRMALHGGINSALMVSGPPDAIRREVEHRIRQLGQDGGYFCAPDQSMPWPDEHRRVLDRAIAEFGRYPLGEYANMNL
ncbi:MAG: uroporphyrinogen decarboxylase family protein [bacterium]